MSDAQLDTIQQYLNSIPDFNERMGQVVRQAIDYAIDECNTGRQDFSSLAKPEKAIVGVKVESYARASFNWPVGDTLDFIIGGIQFDCKMTIGSNWMIPTEAVNQICLLVQADVSANTFNVGLLRTTLDRLTSGTNQDKKRSVSAAGKTQIIWIAYNLNIP